MTGRVGVIEPHTLLGQSINVRRFVEGTAVATHVRPTQVIDQKENDIRMLCSLRVGTQGQQEGTYNNVFFHFQSVFLPGAVLLFQPFGSPGERKSSARP